MRTSALLFILLLALIAGEFARSAPTGPKAPHGPFAIAPRLPRPISYDDEDEIDYSQPPKVLSASRQNGDFEAFEKDIDAHLTNVEEFMFIKAWAEVHQRRVYLFGGSATAFCVYTRWFKEFQNGSPRFSADKFNFALPNIYHSNQDIDILIDGSTSEAEELQRQLQKRYPYEKVAGGKVISVWEVRPLRHSIDMKADILDNNDFQNQNTDSNSTGLVEITNPPSDRSRIQDLRRAFDGEGRFFQDVVNGQITYYHTRQHETTTRAKASNPILISAVRFLIKLFEYDLKTDEISLDRVAKIIKSADIEKITTQRGARRWLEKNAAKLLNNAVNVEAADKVLKKLGLTTKLADVGEKNDPQSMNQLLKLTPLPSLPINSGPGQDASLTAATLGVSRVYLKVSDFLTFERLRSATVGAPNILVYPQRKLYGPDRPAVAVSVQPENNLNGIWVALDVNPNALRGKDFEISSKNSVNVFNRSALTVAPESLVIPREKFIEFVSSNADEEFVFYMIKQFKLLTNATQAEYDVVKNYLGAVAAPTNDSDEEDIFSKPTAAPPSRLTDLLVPLVMNYELRMSQSSPASFIVYIQSMLDKQTMSKPKIAELVMTSLDLFLSLNPTQAEAYQLKNLIRHGPPFVKYMKILMKKYVQSAADYIGLLQFDSEQPSEKYRKRMSYFIEGTFDEFLKLKPNQKELEFVMKQISKENYSKFKEAAHSYSKANLGDCVRFLSSEKELSNLNFNSNFKRNFKTNYSKRKF